jgi:hypothetical protein
MSEDKTSGMIARANAEGGAAFPLAPFRKDGVMIDQPGMSLRDWFAGQALSVIASQSVFLDAQDGYIIARAAYVIADAMLAEREKTKPVAAKPEVKPGDDWTPHNGGPMPCDGNAMVDLRFRDGKEAPESSEAKIWEWKHFGFSHDIIAWRYHKEGA